MSDDNLCQPCPVLFTPSTNPDDFFSNSALTFTLSLVSTSKKDYKLFRLTFSDPPIVLLSPSTFKDIDTLIEVEIEGYTQRTDYSRNLSYNSLGFIDIKITEVTSIKPSTLKVKFQDPNKVRNHSGKKLENGETSISYPGSSNQSGGIVSIAALESVSKVTAVIGSAATTASTGIISLSSIFGVALGMIGKFF